jgi:hypothetical protein
MLQKLGIPTVKCKNKKKKVTEAEKGNETHTALVKKEKETTMWKKRTAMALPGVAEEALCWSCKLKLGSPSSLFCGHCSIKQVGSEARVGFPEEYFFFQKK